MVFGRKFVAWVLGSALVALLLLGYWVVRIEQSHMRREANLQLLSIVSNQSRLLEKWHFERLADAKVLSVSEELVFHVRQMQRQDPQDSQRLVRKQLDTLIEAYHYAGASIVDPEGKILYRSPEAPESFPPSLLSDIQKCLETGNILSTPILNLMPGEPMVAFLVPLINSEDGYKSGAALLFTKTHFFLNQLLGNWAVYQEHGDTVLVQLGEDPPSILSGDYHRMLPGNTPLMESLVSLGKSSGQGEIGHIRDASGHAVLAAAWKVEKTPWTLVALLPESIALGQLYRNTTLIVLSLLFALLTMACFLYALELRKEQNAKEALYQTQLRMEEERKKLLAIFDGINEVIYVSDPETYELLFVNDAFKEQWGTVSPGNKCHQVLQGFDSPCSFCNNHRVFGELLEKTDTWLFQNKRNQRWYQCSDRAIPWIDGRMVRFEMAIDITSRIPMENELLRFKQAIEATSDAVGMAKPDVGHFYQNAAYTRLFGYTLEETQGKQPSDFYENPEEMRTMFEELNQGHRWIKEMAIRRKNGEVIQTLVRADRILDANGDLVA